MVQRVHGEKGEEACDWLASQLKEFGGENKDARKQASKQQAKVGASWRLPEKTC